MTYKGGVSLKETGEEEVGRRDSALLCMGFEVKFRGAKCVKCGGKSAMRKRDG